MSFCFSRLPRRGVATVLASLLTLAASAQDRVLTTAIEVRSLTSPEAVSGIPVRLRGIVVFVESPSAIFLQDETSTTFFRMPAGVPPPVVGDEIEVTSKTRLGLYLPGLDDSTYRLLGRRELPPGIPAQFDDLYFGRYHYQRVTVEGIVRSVQPVESKKSVLRLAMGSRVIEVRVEVPPSSERSLVDHRVRITGLAAGLINTPRRQLVQPYVRVIDWRDAVVVSAAPPPGETPQVSAEDLLAFRVTGLGERRVRLEGVVTATFGRDQVFLEQGTMAFAVRLGQPTPLAPGDRITVVGFPSMERFSASVVDAEVLVRTPGPAPNPLDVATLDELYSRRGDPYPGKHDGRLVRIVGTVRDAFKAAEGTTLLLQGDQRTIQARVPDGARMPIAGAVVRLTGICQVETAVFGPGFRSEPGLVSVRSVLPDGLEVLRTPSWWTTRRLGAVLAALAGLTLSAGGWIAILRRQVRRQTAALRHRIEAEAALEERHRIAREFHDTLEQELAGVSLRLDALATRVADEKGKGLIAASRNLVTRIQVETRDLISDLRDPAETAGDLLAALESVAARANADDDVLVRIPPVSPLPLLPAATVHDLRMIAREAINNARKHGRATHVTVAVETSTDRLTMHIVDNGCGFDVATGLEMKRGHFGCAGMRERGRKIGAEITWQSTLQKGATVAVVVPLRPADVAAVNPSPPPAA